VGVARKWVFPIIRMVIFAAIAIAFVKVVKVGNIEVHGQGDLNEALIENGSGAKVPVTIYRGTDQQTVDVTLGSRPASA